MGSLSYAKATKIIYETPSRKNKPEKLLEDNGLIAVVGLHGLPGTTQNIYNIRFIIDSAVDEARRLYKAGVRNIMVQNVNDTPMQTIIGPDTVAHITAAAYAVRNVLPDDCVMGVSVLRDNGHALVSVASAVEADYIRPKCYVGSVTGIDGVHTGIINEVLEMRYKLKCNVQIWPDIHDRSTVPMGGVTLIDAVTQAVSMGLVDAVNIAGKSFAESLAMVDAVKEEIPGLYVNLGGGASPSNLSDVYAHYDGAFVASCFKDTGNMTGKLDDERLSNFMNIYQKIKNR